MFSEFVTADQHLAFPTLPQAHQADAVRAHVRAMLRRLLVRAGTPDGLSGQAIGGPNGA